MYLTFPLLVRFLQLFSSCTRHASFRLSLPRSRSLSLSSSRPHSSSVFDRFESCPAVVRQNSSLQERYSVLWQPGLQLHHRGFCREIIVRSSGARSLSTEWNNCPLRRAALRRGEGPELPNLKLVRLLPPCFVQLSVLSIWPSTRTFH